MTPDLFRDDDKRMSFLQLADGPFAGTVIATNRVYLSAAAPDYMDDGGRRWGLSCLPGTGRRAGVRRLSTVNMRNMETFVLERVRTTGGTEVRGFVNLRRSVLEAGFGSLHAAADELGVDIEGTTYDAPGPDQAGLAGSADRLTRALRDERVAEAARALADFLMIGRTSYWRHHNGFLADQVTGGSKTPR